MVLSLIALQEKNLIEICLVPGNKVIRERHVRDANHSKADYNLLLAKIQVLFKRVYSIVVL